MNSIALSNLFLILAAASLTPTPVLDPARPLGAPTPVGGAQAPSFGSDGSDGVFVFVPDGGSGNIMTVDLSLAASGLDSQGQPITWQTPSPIAGRGVYDPAVWSIVFKYVAVDVPAGRTVRFVNHPSRAPVVWLAQGAIDVRGTITLNGAPGYWGEPGPGAFRGAGSGLAYSAGFGPGGDCGGGYGNYANLSLEQGDCAKVYGAPGIFPLIGGSGGGCGSVGGGGGAIAIASDASIRLYSTASLTALGAGCASHGGIRLTAESMTLDVGATVYAGTAGAYGTGRIRLEANSFNGAINTSPPASQGTPSQLFADSTTATVEVLTVTVGADTQVVPSDPRASFNLSQADVVMSAIGSATVTLQARNVPLGRTCSVRVLKSAGQPVLYTSTPLAGTFAQSSATANISLDSGVTAIQVRVVL